VRFIAETEATLRGINADVSGAEEDHDSGRWPNSRR
jgi:hypothetical protein